MVEGEGVEVEEVFRGCSKEKILECGIFDVSAAFTIVGKSSGSEIIKDIWAVLMWCNISVGVYAGLVPVKIPPAAIIPKTKIG
jgi:hypothetical protein